jgi:hypothetical protein
MSAQEVVSLLNELVTGFDEMTEKYGMSAIAGLWYVVELIFRYL